MSKLALDLRPPNRTSGGSGSRSRRRPGRGRRGGRHHGARTGRSADGSGRSRTACARPPSDAGRGARCSRSRAGRSGGRCPLPAGAAAAAVVVGLVGVQLLRPPPRPAARLAHRRHGVERLLEHDAVVDVGGREQDGQGDALPVDDEVTLAARLAAVGRVRSVAAPPALAGRLAASSEHRLQSISPALPSRSSSAWWNACQMPASCQSRSRRQQVMPEPQPISCGSISQGMPLFSTNRMPVRAARSSTAGGRPWAWRARREERSEQGPEGVGNQGAAMADRW